MTVPVPPGTRGRDLVVEIKKKRLSVGLKGQPKILEGELCKEIKVEDSTWTLGGNMLPPHTHGVADRTQRTTNWSSSTWRS